MKLERKNIYAGALILSSSIVLFSLLYNNEPPVDVITSDNNTQINYYIRNDSQINNDNVYDYIVVNNSEKIGKSYKVLRFVDSNNYYKVMFVITYVNYDSNGNPIYSICDMVTKEELFKSTMKNRKIDINNIYDISEFLKYSKILSYDEITDLDKYKYMDGVDENVIKNIIPTNIENMFITDEDMVNIYTSLIPENLRVNLQNKQLIR